MNEYERSLNVLGVKEPLTEKDVKTAYKKMIKIHHPDLFTNKKNKQKATENFKKIQTAYEYLLSYGLSKSTNTNSTKHYTQKANEETPRPYKSGEACYEEWVEEVEAYKKMAREFKRKYAQYNKSTTSKKRVKTLAEEHRSKYGINFTKEKKDNDENKTTTTYTQEEQDIGAFIISLFLLTLIVVLVAVL